MSEGARRHRCSGTRRNPTAATRCRRQPASTKPKVVACLARSTSASSRAAPKAPPSATGRSAARHWRWSARTTILASRWTPIPLASWMPSFDHRRLPRRSHALMLDSARRAGRRRRRLRHLSRTTRPIWPGRREAEHADPVAAHRTSAGGGGHDWATDGSGCSAPASRWTDRSTATCSPSSGSSRWSPARDDFQTVDRIIFSELVDGMFTDESRKDYNEVIAPPRRAWVRRRRARVHGDPVAGRPDESPLPTLDSTLLLARAALREAVSG